MSAGTCPDCAEAAVRSWWIFRASCRVCTARGVSRGPNFRASRDGGALTRNYREELRLTELTHDDVKAAAAADFESRVDRKAARE